MVRTTPRLARNDAYATNAGTPVLAALLSAVAERRMPVPNMMAPPIEAKYGGWREVNSARSS